MSARIFTQDVAGIKAGEIRDLDWDSVRPSFQHYHGADIDAVTVDLEEAARRYVASLLRSKAKEQQRTAEPRPVG